MKRTKLYKTYNIIIRSVIIVTSFTFLYLQLFIKQDFNSLIDDVSRILNEENTWGLIIISLALMPLNWSLEALKWKLLLKKKEEITFFVALKAIFSGASISAVSPNRTGDYFGRIFVLKETRFWEGVFITIIGSYAQTITTLIFGGIALFSFLAPALLYSDNIESSRLMFFQYAYVIALTILIALYFRISLISKLVPKKWIRVHKYVNIFIEYKFNQLSTALVISILRYIVFSIQFYILIFAVGIDFLSPFEGLILTSSIFLINTIRPSIALLEIGIRGSVAIFVLGLFLNNIGHPLHLDNAILLASSLLWLINIILPAIIGLFFIKDLRFFKTKNPR